MDLLVYGKRLKRKRSELVQEFGLEGFDDGRIIEIAQKHMAADQQLREAKEAANQQLAGTDRGASAGEVGGGPSGRPIGRAKARRRRRITARLIPLPDHTSRTEEQAREIVGRKKSAPSERRAH